MACHWLYFLCCLEQRCIYACNEPLSALSVRPSYDRVLLLFTFSSTPLQISNAFKFWMNCILSYHRFQSHCHVLEIFITVPLLGPKFVSCFSFIVHFIAPFTACRENPPVVRIRIMSFYLPQEAQGRGILTVLLNATRYMGVLWHFIYVMIRENCICFTSMHDLEKNS